MDISKFLRTLEFLFPIDSGYFESIKDQSQITSIIENGSCKFAIECCSRSSEPAVTTRNCIFSGNEESMTIKSMIAIFPSSDPAKKSIPALICQLNDKLYFVDHTLIAEIVLVKLTAVVDVKFSNGVAMSWSIISVSGGDAELNGAQEKSQTIAVLKSAIGTMNQILVPALYVNHQLYCHSLKRQRQITTDSKPDSMEKCTPSFETTLFPLGQPTPRPLQSTSLRNELTQDGNVKLLEIGNVSTIDQLYQQEEASVSAIFASWNKFLTANRLLQLEPIKSMEAICSNFFRSGSSSECSEASSSSSARPNGIGSAYLNSIADTYLESLSTREEAQFMEKVFSDSAEVCEKRIRTSLAEYYSYGRKPDAPSSNFQDEESLSNKRLKSLENDLIDYQRHIENAAAARNILVINDT